MAERDVRLTVQLLAQRAQQARLADPRLARDQDHLAVAVPGPGPAFHQYRQLVLTADERRQALAAQRLEAAFGVAFALDPEGRERQGEALEAGGPKIGQLEQAADQASGRLADDHLAGRRQRLQPGGEVRGLADHRLLAGGTFADQFADHDQAGGDADPRRQGLPRRRLPSRERVDDREPRPDRPLGVVLMRLRPAEIGEHAVAHELGDVTLEARDLAGDRALIGVDQRAHVLGVELARERGRADQVAEQHRQLPALGIPGRRRRGPSRIGRVGCLGCRDWPRLAGLRAELIDRLEQLAPVADRGDPDRDQVLGGELGQKLGIDVVGGERAGVALQSQVSQPG